MIDVRPFGTFRRYEMAERWSFGVEEAIERLSKKKFLPLDQAREETERWGWITLAHLFDTRFEVEKVFRDPFVVFGFRIDRRRVPANLLRAHVKIEEEAARAAGAKLGPARRREIRKAVRERLLEKTLPAAVAHQVAIAPRAGIVWFSNAGRRANELFVSHFEDTFEIALVAQTPRQLALRLSGGDADAVDRAVPAVFSAEHEPEPAAA